ncbi:ABC transporter substrate-binding protein [Pararhizobium sp. YC-54]|uniref:ABC transporter substrate-binding protein n=1 Tax=Pararhizobium sp. YC-54 TaxID=2986920 RepID=UPI0021F71349|nr:ABC transporter substrate-binding protein [Pararhizobium sp. YC-54]MCW0001572.1 ABC transporter substrate-binding protein [Pararhizobium sp. YC-54]
MIGMDKLFSCGATRRDLLKGAVAGVGGLALSSLPAFNAKATPNRGGTLRVALGHGSTTDTFDPGLFDNDFTIFTGYCYRGHLTEIAPNGSIVGDLAESFESSPDAKTWRFKLRKGVEFHNGKTLDAKDVVSSIQHHMGERSTSAAKALMRGVEIKADGSDAVIFTLDAGNVDLPYIVSDFHFAIMPAASDGSPDWRSGIGTGAYKIDNFEPGVRADLSRQPNFYKENAAFFDGVTVLSVPDATARQTALRAGDVDMIDRVDLKTAHLLSRVPNLAIFETKGTQHCTIPMDVRKAPFNNNDIRLALKYSLDRQKLLDTILLGHGEIGNDHPISTRNKYHNAELPQKTYDPDKAKFHLNRAGMSDLSVDLYVSDAAFAGAVDAAVLYQQHAKQSGININVVREPNDGYWSNIWMKKPWSFSYWGGRPTEDWSFLTAYAPGGNWNETFWENPRFSELLVTARSEFDDSKRRQMYYEMQAILSDDGGAIVPLFINYVDGVTTKLQIPDVVAWNWPHDGHKCHERWWFKS